MADIIRLLAHGEESLEELGNTFLRRTGGSRAGSHGVMMKLRAVLGGLTKHLMKVLGHATERKCDSSMRHIGPKPLLSRDGVFNEALHKSSIVVSEPLLNSPLELLIDKVRHINLPLTVMMGVVHEIDVVAMTSSRVSNLAHNSSPVNASQGVVEVIHVCEVRRRWLNKHTQIRIAEKKILSHHLLRRLGVNAETTTANIIITKTPCQLIKRGGVGCVPDHPRNLPAIARMKVGGAEKLAHKIRAILLLKIDNGPKVHLLQSFLNKEEVGLPVGSKVLGVETKQCHIGIQSSGVIMIIPHSKL
jgi:hypothetical protein